MDPQITQVLTNAQSPDANIRNMSEKWLAEAEKQNPVSVIIQLSKLFVDS
jgi:hypothetical protein